jgi:hypothetical protein
VSAPSAVSAQFGEDGIWPMGETGAANAAKVMLDRWPGRARQARAPSLWKLRPAKLLDLHRGADTWEASRPSCPGNGLSRTKFRKTCSRMSSWPGILASVSYPPPSREVCALHPAEPHMAGRQAVPRHPEAEAMWTDTTWRPCTVLAWARAPGGGWLVFIRWPDGASGWYEHDPGCLRPAGLRERPASTRRAECAHGRAWSPPAG